MLGGVVGGGGGFGGEGLKTSEWRHLIVKGLNLKGREFLEEKELLFVKSLRDEKEEEEDVDESDGGCECRCNCK